MSATDIVTALIFLVVLLLWLPLITGMTVRMAVRAYFSALHQSNKEFQDGNRDQQEG